MHSYTVLPLIPYILLCVLLFIRKCMLHFHRLNSTCLLKPQLGNCLAVYYSTELRSVPDTCKECKDPTNPRCLKKWSRCTKRRDRAAYGSVSSSTYIVK